MDYSYVRPQSLHIESCPDAKLEMYCTCYSTVVLPSYAGASVKAWALLSIVQRHVFSISFNKQRVLLGFKSDGRAHCVGCTVKLALSATCSKQTSPSLPVQELCALPENDWSNGIATHSCVRMRRGYEKH
eukprot:364818-Chlamydomonas_euryale.AAC.24